MKVTSIWIFFAGALFSLLVIFLVKPSFLAPNSFEEQVKAVDLEEEEQEDDVLITKQNSSCDEACVLNVIKRFKTGKNLKNEYGSSILDIESMSTGKYLEDKPEIVAEIEAKLATISSQSERNSILRTFENLPTEQMIAISKRLSASTLEKTQIDGVNMLFSAAKKGADVKDEIASIINNSSASAVFTALQVLYQVYPEDFEEVASERLSTILADTSNEKDQGRALTIKTKTFKIDDSIKNDIIVGLNSNSKHFQGRAIVALDDVLDKQKRLRDPSFNWRTDNKLKLLIEDIANDPSGDLRNRREVINLLMRNY